VLRHREVGRAKNLSAPLVSNYLSIYSSAHPSNYIYIYTHTLLHPPTDPSIHTLFSVNKSAEHDGLKLWQYFVQL